MAAEREPIEISDKPELLRLVEEMEASGAPCVLKRDGEDVALMTPIGRGSNKFGATSEHDPLWRIVGMFKSDGPTDIATDKHKYLAEAYADLHDAPDNDSNA